MIYTLTKDRISIRVSSLGAELKSVCLDGFEYLWQGDPTYWKGQSPILFPIIGGAHHLEALRALQGGCKPRAEFL